jgi:hypothetical protein
VSDETTDLRYVSVPPPQTIGRYVVDHELGRGMMGVVYAAHDSVLGRTVALKTIELAFPAGPDERTDFEERFFTEARIAAKLSHPGIVVCHDVGKDTETGKLFIVFEHLKGQTLAAHIGDGRQVPWAEAVLMLAEVARAIHHAHEHGIVHRDLKPANVMLTDSGRMKIMDFGVAKIETTRFKLTATGQSFGSPLYMSPEQALGHASDARSDVFSLGSILCTLVLGRPCFDAPNIPKILARVIRDAAPALSREVPGVPASLDAVLARAMAKGLDDRYATAEQMAEDLEDVLAGKRPRHASGWALAHREGTLPSPVDPDDLLAELTAPHAALDAAGARTADPLEDLAALVDAPSDGEGAPLALRRRDRVRVISLIAVVVAVVAAIAWFVTNAPKAAPAIAQAVAPTEPEAKPSEPAPASITTALPLSSTAAPSAAPSATRRPRIATAAADKPAHNAPTAAPTDVPTAAPAAGAHLRMTVEYPFQKGHLTLWIDGALRYETELEARVMKKVVVTKVREGRLEHTLDLEPGKHQLRVEVAWEDNRRVETILGRLDADATHQLAVRVGGITKALALEWK